MNSIPNPPQTNDLRMNEFNQWVWQRLKGVYVVGGVLFGGENGVYTQDETNFLWDNTANQLTVSSIAISTFTAGSILFVGASGVFTQDNANLFWDVSNHRLGIGTTSPSAKLHLAAGGTAANSGPLKFTSGGPLATAEAGVLEYDGDLKWTASDGARGILHREDGYNESVYSSSSIGLTTSNDASFTDVDATNANITFTVNIPGKYKVEFQFIWASFTNAAGASFASYTFFRLSDGTNNSSSVQVAIAVDGEAGQATQLRCPVSLTHVFDFTTTGSKTVKLQRKNTVSTNVGSRVISLDSTNDAALVMRTYRLTE